MRSHLLMTKMAPIIMAALCLVPLLMPVPRSRQPRA